MGKDKNRLVLVRVREGVNLPLLASNKSPLENPCGAIGPMIAEYVLKGNGVAMVDAGDLKMAFDTNDGVNAIMDCFDLEDPTTNNPLLFELLR